MQPPGSSFVLVVVAGLTGILSGPHVCGSLYGGDQSDATSTSPSTAPVEVLTVTATTPPSTEPRVFNLPIWGSGSVINGLLLGLLVLTLGRLTPINGHP